MGGSWLDTGVPSRRMGGSCLAMAVSLRRFCSAVGGVLSGRMGGFCPDTGIPLGRTRSAAGVPYSCSVMGVASVSIVAVPSGRIGGSCLTAGISSKGCSVAGIPSRASRSSVSAYKLGQQETIQSTY